MYLLRHRTSDREYLRAPDDDLETDIGVLTVPSDVSHGDVLHTHLDEPFDVRAPRGPDLFDHLYRTGAPMMPRDVILDAGTGTGILAAYLGRLDLNVTTYERDPNFAETARENVRVAGVADRVDIRTGDVVDDLDGLTGDEWDLVTLDTGDAPAIVERSPDLLAPGAFVAVYAPFVESARAAHQVAEKVGLSAVETFETIQRRMSFDGRGSRPSTAGVGHTGYLTFARRR